MVGFHMADTSPGVKKLYLSLMPLTSAGAEGVLPTYPSSRAVVWPVS